MTYRRPLPDQQRIIDRIDYDASTGIAVWRRLPDTCQHNRCFNGRFAGKPIGSITRSGYLAVGFDGTNYRLHRLILKLVDGIEPPLVDHADGDRLNNRWANLRPCTAAQSAANRRTLNLTGCKGVSSDGRGRFRARVMVAGHTYFLGSFVNKADAALAARNARKMLHGIFASDRTEIPRITKAKSQRIGDINDASD